MLVVDTYNVLQTTAVLPTHLAGIELDGLARLLSASRYARGRRILVCDGRPHSAALVSRAGRPIERERGGRIVLHGSEVLFAGHGNEADAVIERLLETDSAPARMIVVSSDRRVRRAAGRRGAKVLGSPELLHQLALDHDRPPKEADPAWADEIPLDGPSIDIWMRFMGVSDGLVMQAEAEAQRERLPERATVEQVQAEPEGAEATKKAGRAGDRSGGRSQGEKRGEEKRAREAPATTPSSQPTLGITDPELLRLLRTWPGGSGIDPADLDMARWLARETRRGR